MRSPAPASRGELLTINGTQYFVLGKTRIKVTEHFPEKGPSISSLIEDLIIYTGNKT